VIPNCVDRDRASRRYNENSGNQRKTAGNFAVISIVEMATAQDFRGGRGGASLIIFAKTATNGEAPMTLLAGVVRS
jgi:hypothetical protein